jgi:hypothetical protein
MEIIYEDKIPQREVHPDESEDIMYRKYQSDEIPTHLIELFVDPEFVLGRSLTDRDLSLLAELKDEFGPGALITYAEVRDWIIAHGRAKRNKSNNVPWLTLRLNRLYRSGRIRKFNAKDEYQKLGRDTKHKVRGVTYKLSDAITGFDTPPGNQA